MFTSINNGCYFHSIWVAINMIGTAKFAAAIQLL
jgi:hypothetical protein